MTKHDTDPVLRQLVHAINESEQAAVPVTVSAHGTLLTGALIAERRYFSELVEGNPLMSALETETESDHHLHIRTGPGRTGEVAEGLWRISLEAVDGWSLGADAAAGGEDDRGPFARLLGTP